MTDIGKIMEEANNSLQAAAPELLEICKEMNELFMSLIRNEHVYFFDRYIETHPEANITCNEVRAKMEDFHARLNVLIHRAEQWRGVISLEVLQSMADALSLRMSEYMVNHKKAIGILDDWSNENMR
jgi:hypothetical protein